MRASVVIAVVVASLAACGDRRREPKEPPRDALRPRRVIEPSSDRVGPLPPYAIRADGVGPYKLGEKLSDLLERLASGPRIALFEIPGVVHRNVIRAEDDAILIGGEQASTASFVAVVGSDVARTESGIHVGSTRDEVTAALGAAVDDPERARDPRLLAPSGVPSLRAVLDGDRVVAIVVASGALAPRHVTDCQRPPSTDKAVGACLTPAGELVEVADDIMVRNADGDRALAPPLRVPGLVFAVPLRSAAEARDELVVVTRSEAPQSRTWWLSVYRLEGSRLVRSVDATQLYQLSSANARWIGADLRDVELYLELTSRPEAIEVGGILTTLSSSREATKIRDVVGISPASVPRKRGKSAAIEASDASVAAPGTTSGPSVTASAGGAGNAGTAAGVSAPPPARVTPDAATDASDTAGPAAEPGRP